MTDASGRWRALGLLSLSTVLILSLWFSATAVAPELSAAWGLTSTEAAWLTSAVQVGFVVGALASAGLTLSDVVAPRHLIAASAVLGAAATATIAATVTSLLPAVALRFLTGLALAGVYPPAMKVMAGWFSGDRGLAIGVLVGAVTLGSAMPHLLRWIGGVGHPRLVLYGSAGLAVAGAILALLVDRGPHQAPESPFDPAAVSRIARDRPTVLANLGYYGHNWELYGLWTWVPAFVAASVEAGTPGSASLAPALAFGTIAVGGLGAGAAGYWADRVGRTTITSASLVASGLACLAAGAVFGGPVLLLVPFLLAWGFVVVADSAQFSTCVTELAEPGYVGTALTLQTAVGFLITVGSIQLVPAVAAVVGWRWAFVPLAIGPALGTAAMLRLRARPEARQLAGGRG